jgi:fibronectin-binding autotransporter adhesin
MSTIKSGIAALIIGIAAGSGAVNASTWNTVNGGNWSDDTATGWNGTGVPNAIDAIAIFNQPITTNPIINLDVSAIVGSLTLTDTNTSNFWTINDTVPLGTTLTFDVTSGTASLSSPVATFGNNAHAINVPIVLNDTLAVDTVGRIALSGKVSGAGGITKTGAESLFIGGGTANTYAGLTKIDGGRLGVVGSTTAIAGDIEVNSGGTLDQGASNVISDTSNVVVNGTGVYQNFGFGETINNITINGGVSTVRNNGGAGAFLGVNALNLAGGTLNIGNGNNSAVSNVTAASVAITQPGSGAYTAIAQAGASSRVANLNLNGNLTFIGAAGNTNSTSITSNGVNTQIVLSQATTTLTVGNGGADVDLIIQPRFVLTTGGGAEALTKDGLGTLELQGVSTYTGPTTASAGRLLVHGGLATASATTVASGASFGGKGAIGALTVDSGGGYYDSLSKAISGSQPVADTDYFQTNVTGAVSLGGADFQLTIGNGIEAGDIFFLIANDGTDSIPVPFATLNGTITDLSQDAFFTSGGQTFQISYTADTGTSAFSGAGNDLALLVVPEPQTWAMLLGGFGMLLGFQRARRARR